MIIFRHGCYPCLIFLSGRRLFCGFPLAMSAAAQLKDRPASVNIAALAQVSFCLFLAAPPLLGLVAEEAGFACLRHLSAPDTSCLFHPEKGVLKKLEI